MNDDITIPADTVMIWTIRMIDSVLKDVRDMLDDGTLPANTCEYAQVHEVRDGNVLGDFEEGCMFFERKYGHLTRETPGDEFEPVRDVFFQICNVAHATVGWWLRTRHHVPVASPADATMQERVNLRLQDTIDALKRMMR